MLADDIAQALPEMRAQAESLMTSTCTVTRSDDEPVWDEQSGTYTDPEPVTVYEGRCKVRPATTWGRGADAGEANAMLSSFFIHLPFTTTGVAVGDTVTVLTSPDPDLAGRALVVRFVPDRGDFVTARRLVCEAA